MVVGSRHLRGFRFNYFWDDYFIGGGVLFIKRPIMSDYLFMMLAAIAIQSLVPSFRRL